jgi:cytochrome c5
MYTYVRPPLWLAFTLLLAGCGETGGNGTDVAAGDAREASVPPIVEPSPSYDPTRGAAVFRDKCLRCHGDGLYDAPRLGDAMEWKARLDQGLDTLIAHAIEGHGRMPPRGGFHELSDAEIAAAVAYVVDRSRAIILASGEEQLPSGCHPVRKPEKCSAREAEEVLTLHMLWLLTTPDKR